LLNSRCLCANIFASQSPNASLNILNMGINQRINSCFRSLVNACSIYSAFKE
jgi:hypothetical protein